MFQNFPSFLLCCTESPETATNLRPEHHLLRRGLLLGLRPACGVLHLLRGPHLRHRLQEGLLCRGRRQRRGHSQAAAQRLQDEVCVVVCVCVRKAMKMKPRVHKLCFQSSLFLHLCRLYYQISKNSSTLARLCKLACVIPNLDLCDVERNPKYKNARYSCWNRKKAGFFAMYNFEIELFPPSAFPAASCPLPSGASCPWRTRRCLSSCLATSTLWCPRGRRRPSKSFSITQTPPSM